MSCAHTHSWPAAAGLGLSALGYGPCMGMVTLNMAEVIFEPDPMCPPWHGLVAAACPATAKSIALQPGHCCSCNLLQDRDTALAVHLFHGSLVMLGLQTLLKWCCKVPSIRMLTLGSPEMIVAILGAHDLATCTAGKGLGFRV